MQTPLVMTVIGQDRPGIVDLVASVVTQHQGNWLESRMCRLGGEFAGLLQVEVPNSQLAALKSALEELGNHGLTVVVRVNQANPVQTAPSLTTLEILGQDRPGIVQQISRCLAIQNINVEEIHSELISAAMSGEELFKARLAIRLPPDCNFNQVRTELEKIASDLFVDISIGNATS